MSHDTAPSPPATIIDAMRDKTLAILLDASEGLSKENETLRASLCEAASTYARNRASYLRIMRFQFIIIFALTCLAVYLVHHG